MMKIPFSPPDMTEQEAQEVREAILSGWITTGPRTKELERQVSDYIHTEKTVCLNSATAAMEMALHLLGIGPGDEVIIFVTNRSSSLIYPGEGIPLWLWGRGTRSDPAQYSTMKTVPCLVGG